MKLTAGELRYSVKPIDYSEVPSEELLAKSIQAWVAVDEQRLHLWNVRHAANWYTVFDPDQHFPTIDEAIAMCISEMARHREVLYSKIATLESTLK